MRAGLMPILVIVMAVIGAGPSRSEEPRLPDKTPDGAQLIDLYKAARTVADVEAANGKVERSPSPLILRGCTRPR